MRLLVSLLTTMACGLAGPLPAAAQASVPAQGEGTLSLTYQVYHHSGHFDRQGRKNSNGATQSQVLLTQAEVAVTDSLAITVSLPFIASKYTGPEVYFVEGIETHPGPLDDRTYHAAFQDVRVSVRRMFESRGVIWAPVLSVAVPTHDYETRGEAVPGRHRSEIQAGVRAECDLSAIVPRTWVLGSYAYAALEKEHGYPHTRSNVDVEIGAGFTSRLEGHVGLAWQVAHAKPTIPELATDWLNHDRFINATFFDLAIGGAIAVDQRTSIHVIGTATLSGRRGAHVARALSVGVTRSFGGGFRGLGG